MANSTQPQDKRRRSLLYLLLIVLLVIINGVLFYTNMQTKGENEALETERQELREQQVAYERKVDSLKLELMSEIGLNAELDSIINHKIRELDSLKISFSKRIANKDYEIGRLKQELSQKIAEIERKTQQYTNEIEDWKTKYEELAAENEELSEELVNKDEDIRELENKIEQGAVLTATEINPVGIQYKGKNREKETDRAKRVDKLKVCFQLAENRIATPGYRDILIKITSPEGTTLSMESLGSGTFKLTETGESSLYTTKLSIEYDPSEPEQQYCAEWEQELEYQPGIYNFELYQDGFLIGEKELELEKGGLF